MRHSVPVSLAALTALSLFAAPAAQADRIFKVDGSTLEDVEVRDENLREVEYKVEGQRQSKTLPTQDVLRVAYSRLPEQVDSALGAVEEERYIDAVNDLEEFLARFEDKPPRTFHNSVPFAQYKLVQIYESTGEFAQVVGAADRLIGKSPESRYAILAHISKVEALNLLGEAEALTSAVQAFEQFASSNSLAPRWRLEAELRGVLFHPTLKGDARRKRLAEVAQAAGNESPIVQNRATVAIGESYLNERKLGEAEQSFAKVADDPKADGVTLAAAYTGLGDCIYQRAANTSDAEAKEGLLKEARLHYLRVVVLHGDQVQYLPKALFYAGRVFDELDALKEDQESRRRAQLLYSRVIRNFPGSKWANEAKAFRRRV